jgi:exodeoxyribonuclease V alpha subunit
MRHRIIKDLHRKGIVSEIDIHFAKFIENISAFKNPAVFLGAALVSHAAENGDICLDLNAAAGKTLPAKEAGEKPLTTPEIELWQEALWSCPAVGRPGDKRPLILDEHNRLYLFRYWEYEKKLSESIKKRAAEQATDLNLSRLKDSICRYFPENAAQDGIDAYKKNIDWQKIAAVTAILKRFSVITGGPGSGKTFTIAKILALLLEQTPEAKLEIYLAAPTGKAAARLKESLQHAVGLLNCSQEIKNAIPTEVYTIHRLLKPIPDSPYFRHNSDNPLSAAMVVVDEASMVDLALMSKLVQAVPLKSRLVLIGDKDQLASVEAGSVLGDICDRNNLHGFSNDFCQKVLELTHDDLSLSIHRRAAEPGLQDCIVVLQKSYRFGAGSGIGGLSQAVNHGDIDRTLDLLKKSNDPSVAWYAMDSVQNFWTALANEIIAGYSEYLKRNDPASALDCFRRFRILCAVRIGPFGVNAINRLAEQILMRRNLIQPHPDATAMHPWYPGRPIMITRNDYTLGLFNGDIGITMPDASEAGNDLWVFFPGSSGEIRRFAPYRLPEPETVFAMTVHKSQGSEFDEVVFVLPDKNYPLLTRELIYTGLTRAKKKISIWGARSILANAVSRKIERTSGLQEALWG